MSNHDSRAVVRELRRARQLRRLGDTEWYDVAYRAYLFALGGLIAIVLASDAINGFVGDDVTTSDLLGRGPSTMGVLVAVAFGLGLRSGSDGGPVSIELPDIRHVLLAPVARRWVMLRPIVQRLRSVMFALGFGLAIVGQFVAREVEGSRPAWAAAGVLFGGLVGAVFVSSAVIAHAIRLPRWTATLITAGGVGWQAFAAWSIWNDATGLARIGPANLDGSVAFWGIRQRGIDWVAIAFVVVWVLLALALGGRLRIEALSRRGELVSQLRFAATVQDLRTVVMLRRQLRAETPRAKLWGARRRRAPRVANARPQPAMPQLIWIRGLRSLRRLSLSRIGRIVALAALAGVSASLTVDASPLFVLGVLVAIFLLGMEAIEPLSQEIDRPDITDSLPVDRGWLFTHHLVAPGILLAGAGMIGAAAAAAVEPDHAAAAFAVAIPVAWAGAIGPVVGAVLDAPAPIRVANTTITGKPRRQEGSLVPPEFAGLSMAFTTFMPVLLSAIGALSILALRSFPSGGTAARIDIGLVLAVAAAVFWIRRRDRWGIKMRAFFDAGRAELKNSTAPPERNEQRETT